MALLALFTLLVIIHKERDYTYDTTHEQAVHALRDELETLNRELVLARVSEEWYRIEVEYAKAGYCPPAE